MRDEPQCCTSKLISECTRIDLDLIELTFEAAEPGLILMPNQRRTVMPCPG